MVVKSTFVILSITCLTIITFRGPMHVLGEVTSKALHEHFTTKKPLLIKTRKTQPSAGDKQESKAQKEEYLGCRATMPLGPGMKWQMPLWGSNVLRSQVTKSWLQRYLVPKTFCKLEWVRQGQSGWKWIQWTNRGWGIQGSRRHGIYLSNSTTASRENYMYQPTIVFKYDAFSWDMTKLSFPPGNPSPSKITGWKSLYPPSGLWNFVVV